MLYSNAFDKYRCSSERVQKWVGYFLGALQETKSKVLLDCGCGTGRFTVPMSELFEQAFGVDRNESMLYAAREKESRVVWIQSDVSAIPLKDNSVDVILASMLIEHLERLEDFLEETKRLLKEDGMMLIRTMLPEDIYNTTWYGLSKKASDMELARTYGLKELVSRFSCFGFRLWEEKSVLHVEEQFENQGLSAKISSKCYEILHQLEEEEFNALLVKAKTWEEIKGNKETACSSLLVFHRRKPYDKSLL